MNGKIRVRKGNNTEYTQALGPEDTCPVVYVEPVRVRRVLTREMVEFRKVRTVLSRIAAHNLYDYLKPGISSTPIDDWARKWSKVLSARDVASVAKSTYRAYRMGAKPKPAYADVFTFNYLSRKYAFLRKIISQGIAESEHVWLHSDIFDPSELRKLGGGL